MYGISTIHEISNYVLWGLCLIISNTYFFTLLRQKSKHFAISLYSRQFSNDEGFSFYIAMNVGNIFHTCQHTLAESGNLIWTDTAWELI